MVYALASTASLILAGPLIDRLTAMRLVPVSMLPLGLSCLALVFSDSVAMAPLFLAFLGLGSGLGQVIRGALWAELYGVTHLGAIRAFSQATMVISSGLGPAVMGILFDFGTAVETIALVSAFFCLGAGLTAAFARRPQRFAVEPG